MISDLITHIEEYGQWGVPRVFAGTVYYNEDYPSIKLSYKLNIMFLVYIGVMLFILGLPKYNFVKENFD